MHALDAANALPVPYLCRAMCRCAACSLTGQAGSHMYMAPGGHQRVLWVLDPHRAGATHVSHASCCSPMYIVCIVLSWAALWPRYVLMCRGLCEAARHDRPLSAHLRAPAPSSAEVFLRLPYNDKVDVFSFGCLAYEVLGRQLLLVKYVGGTAAGRALGVKLPAEYAAKVRVRRPPGWLGGVVGGTCELWCCMRRAPCRLARCKQVRGGAGRHALCVRIHSTGARLPRGLMSSRVPCRVHRWHSASGRRARPATSLTTSGTSSAPAGTPTPASGRPWRRWRLGSDAC